MLFPFLLSPSFEICIQVVHVETDFTCRHEQKMCTEMCAQTNALSHFLTASSRSDKPGAELCF